MVLVLCCVILDMIWLKTLSESGPGLLASVAK
jgi:hypothetical protein